MLCLRRWNLLVKLKLRRVIDMSIDEVEKIKTVVENKDYIVQLVNTVVKTLVEAFENLKIEDVNMFQLGYNKAIDDFSTDIINKINFEHKWLFDCKSNNADTDIAFSALITFINELAEQLKAGGENENYNKEES